MASQDQAVIEFMKTRRSVPAKTMSGPGPSDEDLSSILEIASRVPDHGKIAPWRFIRYSAKACERLGEQVLERALVLNPDLNEEMQAIEKNRFLRVPVVIAVVSTPRDHPKVPEWEQVLSAGAVAMNMVIAANAHGFDAQWLTEWIAFDEALREPLGLQEGERVAGFIHMGTRTMSKTERDRPEVATLLTVLEA